LGIEFFAGKIMLSRAQQILLKRAQAEAALDDADYRDAIATVSGMADCRSSTDARLTDRHVDNLLSYFEAIFWKKFDATSPLTETMQAVRKANAIFRQRGYWASKNPKNNTSRDRYGETNLQPAVSALEAELAGLGCGMAYCRAIQNKIVPFSLAKYLGALNRTVKAKRAKANQPF
jgi:hypothetical protein